MDAFSVGAFRGDVWRLDVKRIRYFDWFWVVVSTAGAIAITAAYNQWPAFFIAFILVMAHNAERHGRGLE